MKRIILAASVVLLALVATGLWLGCAHSSPRKAEVNPQSGMPPATITDADEKDYKQWSKTPEYKTFEDEHQRLLAADELRGAQGERPDAYLTSNEVAFVITYMQSPHPRARSLAVIAAGGTWPSDPARSIFLPHVVSLLADPFWRVRMCAADTLGVIGDKGMIPYLEPLLNDPSPHVARTAQRIITKLQKKEAAPGK